MASIVFVPQDVLDAPLDIIVSEGELVHLTPALWPEVTYDEVISLSIGSYTPILTKVSEGNGRKIRLDQMTGIKIDTVSNFDGEAQIFSQFVIVSVTKSQIRFIGKGTNKFLNHSDRVNTPAADIINPAISLVV